MMEKEPAFVRGTICHEWGAWHMGVLTLSADTTITVSPPPPSSASIGPYRTAREFFDVVADGGQCLMIMSDGAAVTVWPTSNHRVHVVLVWAPKPKFDARHDRDAPRLIGISCEYLAEKLA